MFVLKKRLRNAAISHRLRAGYPGKCKNIHGHEYFFEVEVGGTELNQYGMLIDFADIKEVCDDWIQENWDHGVIVGREDTIFYHFLDSEGSKLWVAEWEGNTTAENMSKFLAELFFSKLIEKNVSLHYLTMRVWETDTSVAQYTVYA